MIIDIHTHIFPPDICREREAFFAGEPAFELLYRDPQRSPLTTAEGLLEAMDQDGIQGSVCFAFPWKNPELLRRCNDYVLEAMQKHPDRLLGFACLNPDHPDAVSEGERCLAAGMKGLGEIASYASSTGEAHLDRLRPLIRLAEGHQVPFLLHVNEPVGHTYPGKGRQPFWELYEVIKAFPRVRFILAHWGGGLWWYLLMKREVSEVLTHTWFDTAASPFLYRPEIYRYAVQILGPGKILYGSDYPLLGLRRYLKEMEAARLGEEDKQAILGENSRRLLGWPDP